MSDFKGRHFGGEIVLWAVRWYCRYLTDLMGPFQSAPLREGRHGAGGESSG